MGTVNFKKLALASFTASSTAPYAMQSFAQTQITEETYLGKAFIDNSVNIRYLNALRTYGMCFKAFF